MDLVEIPPNGQLDRHWHPGEEFHDYLEGDPEITIKVLTRYASSRGRRDPGAAAGRAFDAMMRVRELDAAAIGGRVRLTPAVAARRRTSP